ncbi:hypothetical protein LTR09_005645 [Extremus antarcticus]|uniref:Uncharacterized protein n=1 Tax=Extremus antarcticus TaxID=702011 RepID=A0AAJ0G9K3_9PEZI|nr:hypothetical protein LTR09_005645 [Extremus antarcticus]
MDSAELVAVKIIWRWIAGTTTAPAAAAVDCTGSTTATTSEIARFCGPGTKAFFNARMAEQASRSALSAIPTAMAAASSDYTGATSQLAEESIKINLWAIIEWLFNYVVFPACFLYLIFGFVDWRGWSAELLAGTTDLITDLITAAAPTALALAIWLILLPFRIIAATTAAVIPLARHFHLREGADATTRSLDYWYIYLRYSWPVDLAYLHYQLGRNWIGRHKFHLLAAFLAIWYLHSRHQQVVKQESLDDWLAVGGRAEAYAMYLRHRAQHLGLSQM